MMRFRVGLRLTASTLLALSLSVGSVFAVAHSSAEEGKVQRFTILHTNDHHGRFWPSSRGEWGMPARMTLLRQLRQEIEGEGGHVLLLSGGDINTGVPESDMQSAIPDFLGMKMLGYDAMAIGNHEFDNPREVLDMQRRIAGFPFLSANILDEKTGKHAYQPYTSFQVGNIKIGVLGLTTLDTPKLTDADNTKGLRFISPEEAARKVVPFLRKKNDVVIAVTHMGHYQDGNHGVNAPGDVSLARNVDGIDMIVGGHSQTPLFRPDRQNGTWIVQAHEWGKYVGRADFEFRDGTLSLVDYKLIPVNHRDKQTLVQDEEMVALLQPYQVKGESLVNQKLGTVDDRLAGERSEVRFGYTNLGTMMTQSMKNKAGADLAVMNSGGIRASINAGDITYRDILQVSPFGNALAYVDMSGKEVVEYLQVVGSKPVDSGAFAHFSGVEMMIDGDKVNVLGINGEPVDMDKTYRMALMNFSAKGGDGYPVLSDHAGYVDTGYVDADVMREFVERNSPLQVEKFVPAGIERR